MAKKSRNRLQEYQENFNDSYVTLPPNFVGMGNNTRGRNYSPAWGGQFADGGMLQNVARYHPIVIGTKKLMSNLAENIDPFGYEDSFKRVINAAILNKKDPARYRDEKDIKIVDNGGNNNISRNDYNRIRERVDLLQILVNKPQKYNSIPDADYRPTVEKNKYSKYYKSPLTEEELNKYISSHHISSENDLPEIKKSKTLGNIILNYGTDEKGNYISYYDKWDLNPVPKSGINWLDEAVDKVVTGVPNVLGITNTPEVYGRVYLPKKRNGGEIIQKRAYNEFKKRGNVPETVDFIYTRHGAPSEGKYAKKTLPSAEDGVNIQDLGQYRKLNQLINFTNYNEPQPGGYINNNAMKGKAKTRKAVNGATSPDKAGFDFNQLVDPVSGIAGGIVSLIEETKKRKGLEQWAEISDVVRKASETRPEKQKRRYLRPEDNVNTGEEFFPIYGVGTNVLAKDGISVTGRVGGNPTEIQNMYQPGTLFNDLGFEPINNNIKVKDFNFGGKITKAANGFEKFLTQGGGNLITSVEDQIFEDNAGYQIGKSVGSALSFIPGVGPIAGALASPVLGAIGGLLDPNQKKIKRANKKISQNISGIGMNQAIQQFQDTNAGYMEHGGEVPEYEWVSHTWQPQVITKFGEHKVSELLKPDKTMDTLRAGGHLKEYTKPSKRALQTYAMGGELLTHWGGYAEPISENPYLPGNGETVMFRGQSHEETDGRGRTGIGITYGNSPVEVERGEPAVKLQDGGNDESLVVFGNLPIPKQFVPLLGDPDAKGKKFKNYISDISKKENKANKLIDKSVSDLDDLQVITPFDKLKFSGLSANIEGSNMKLKSFAEKKENAAYLQSAINDTADEQGLDADALAQGKVKRAKRGLMIAEDGYVSKYGLKPWEGNVTGLGKKTASSFTAEEWDAVAERLGFKGKGNKEFQEFLLQNPESRPLIEKRHKELYGKSPFIDSKLGYGWEAGALKLSEGLKPISPKLATKLPSMELDTKTLKKPVVSTLVEEEKNKFDWLNALSKTVPYLRPSDAEELDPRQLAGEMFALATNQVEPVWAQTIQPDLTVPYDISYQEMLDENQADYRATQRMVGYNPAALSILNAQKYQANQKVLAEQFRANQTEKARAYEKNRDILTSVKLQNLGILDKQYERQEMAKANTKATTLSALSSISDKFLKNKLEGRTLRTYENLYNYRYDDKGRIINMNAPADFNLPEVVGQDINAPVVSDKKKSGRNGSIVSAMKNF